MRMASCGWEHAAEKKRAGCIRAPRLTTLLRVDAPTGTISTIRGGNGEVWVGTDGHGVFRFSGSRKTQRFTFDGTAGGLRSDHVYSIFVDREGVVWFGTDRGVCRFDPQAPRVESIGGSAESNFVRTLYQTYGRPRAGRHQSWSLRLRRRRADMAHSYRTCSQHHLFNRRRQEWTGCWWVRPVVFLLEHGPSRTPEPNRRLLRVSRQVPAMPMLWAASGRSRDFANGIYIASYKRGVELFEDPRVRIVWPRDGDGSREVISLFADGDARLLIGTTNDGVFSFDGQEAEADPAFAKLKGSTVRSIARTNDGTLWFATNRGVYLCRPGNDCMVAAPDLDARSLVAVKSLQLERSLVCNHRRRPGPDRAR